MVVLSDFKRLGTRQIVDMCITRVSKRMSYLPSHSLCFGDYSGGRAREEPFTAERTESTEVFSVTFVVSVFEYFSKPTQFGDSHNPWCTNKTHPPELTPKKRTRKESPCVRR